MAPTTWSQFFGLLRLPPALSPTWTMRALLGLLPSTVTFSLSWGQEKEISSSPADVRALVQRYCLECHSGVEPKGDLDLEQLVAPEHLLSDAERWSLVEQQLVLDAMPPTGANQPSLLEREQLLAFTRSTLATLSQAQAGDPGPVVLRRLSNAELGYALRDLTGLAALDPARDLPADGAAGEGFTNVGNALVMSPMLLEKYLGIAREVARHAVLLPDGIRFDEGTSRREWTDACLERIRAFHGRFAQAAGSDEIDANGVVIVSDGGGRLPLERYLAAALELRDVNPAEAHVVELARSRDLSAKYLHLLCTELAKASSSLVLGGLQARWRGLSVADLNDFVGEIEAWQRELVRFERVSHLGKVGGPTAWQVPVDNLLEHQDVRLPLGPTAEGESVRLSLRAIPVIANDASAHVFWSNARIQKAGWPALALDAVAGFSAAIVKSRTSGRESLRRTLLAIEEWRSNAGAPQSDSIAARHGLEPQALERWLSWLGLTGAEQPLTGHLTEPLTGIAAAATISGYGGGGLPNVLIHRGEETVQVPGRVVANSIVVHPAPDHGVKVVWRAPLALELSVQATIEDAHEDCGNGVEWMLDVERGDRRWRYASGLAIGLNAVALATIPRLHVQAGDRVLLRIAPGDRDHTCDLTRVDLVLTARDRRWQLAQEVCASTVDSNPYADALGHPAVWHFCAEPVDSMHSAQQPLPEGSSLASWLASEEPTERLNLLERAARALDTSELAPPAEARLREQLLAIDGPICGGFATLEQARRALADAGSDQVFSGLRQEIGSQVVFDIPAELAVDAEFLASAQLIVPDAGTAATQLRVTLSPEEDSLRFQPGSVLCGGDASGRAQLKAAFAEFRALFPAALCYAKIVPVDEVVTLTLYHREDEPLRRLLLEPEEAAELDQLWRELHFVSQDALVLVDAFEQLLEYATQDSDPTLFEPLREPILARADRFRTEQSAAEPGQLEALLALAERAWRRPLSEHDQQELRAFYARLRAEDHDHDGALRTLLARVLLSPHFLYREEHPGEGSAASAINDFELASRLSFFLWSSLPDDELLRCAADGRLHAPAELVRQTRRMLADPKVRRLAREFGCAWLDVQGLEELNEKSERHFPTFPDLRAAMQEEVVRYFIDFFQCDASILSLIASDHLFVNGPLAEHYQIPGVEGEQWQRVEGAASYGRGGVLTFAASLSKHAGASRTSPILRGNWVCEALLGERLPRPPKDVPRLPEDEAAQDLSVRALTERHSQDPLCANCHVRMDPFGFVLERYDAIGRLREFDLGGREIDAHATTRDGIDLVGLEGLRNYILHQRRNDFVHQFCKKLLGYALGRAVQLSDQPLLEQIEAQLANENYRVGRLIESIVSSPQFLRIRGRDAGG